MHSKKSNTEQKMEHRISIIIPSVRPDSVLKTKEACLNQSLKPIELIIVHDKKRHGPAWARNKGIARSTGDLIAFIDDDCIPPKNWLKDLVSAIDKYDADGAGGTYEETDAFLHDIRMRRSFPDSIQIDHSGLVGAGGNVMYTKQALIQLQQQDGYMFNEQMSIAEDIELAWRLRRNGNNLVYVPANPIHLKSVTPTSYLCAQFGRGLGIAVLHNLQRNDKSNTQLQRSRIWGYKNKSSLMKWLSVFVYKALGPFDMKSFTSKSDFLIFWLGEKVQALGFIWAMVKSQ